MAILALVAVMRPAVAKDWKKGLISNIEEDGGRKAPAGRSLPAPKPPPSRIPGRVHAHTLSLGLGQSFLFGKLGKYGEDSITPDLYYSFSASHSFGFSLNVHYSSHKLKEKEAQLRGLALGIKGKFWQFDALSPYALLGLGFYSPYVSDAEDEISLGAHGGLGVELQLNDRINSGLLFHLHRPALKNKRNNSKKRAEGYYGKIMIVAGYTF